MEHFNRSLVQSLVAEGLSESQAVQVAATEMEGVAENLNGTVHGFQTYCNILGYPEDLQPSVGAEQGRVKCTKDVAEWLKAHGFNSLREYYLALGVEA